MPLLRLFFGVRSRNRKMKRLPEQQRAVIDKVGLAYGVLKRWRKSLAGENAGLDRTAIYDAKTGAPVNDAAKIQSALLSVDEHLTEAEAIMCALREAYDVDAEPVEHDRTTAKITLTSLSA